MPQFLYDRSAVPFGEYIRLYVQFTDVAGNNKDTDSYPTVGVSDGAGAITRAASSASVRRTGPGLYLLQYTVPDGYASGTWSDEWVGSVDGYSLEATFEFEVSSIGGIQAVNTDAEPLMVLGDDPDITYSQAEILGINILLKGLKSRLRNTAISPDGTPCPVVPDSDLIEYLRLALSELNVAPTITFYQFSDELIYGLFSDVIIEGAWLKALSIVQVLSAGQELVIVDQGVQITPAPISTAIASILALRQPLYMEKLKALKHGIKPAPRGMGAGRIIANNPAIAKQRHKSEGRLL